MYPPLMAVHNIFLQHPLFGLIIDSVMRRIGNSLIDPNTRANMLILPVREVT